jgi:hypothetical protein
MAHDTSFVAKLVTVATAVSLLAIRWCGPGWEWRRWPRGRRSAARRRTGLPAPRGRGLLALLIVVGQVLLDGLTAKSGFTHYFNATWIAFAFLAWLAVDALPARLLRGAVAGVLAASTLTVVLTSSSGSTTPGRRGSHTVRRWPIRSRSPAS